MNAFNWYLHAKYFELNKLLNPNKSEGEIEEEIKNADQKSFKQKIIMENEAKKISYCVAMPIRTLIAHSTTS